MREELEGATLIYFFCYAKELRMPLLIADIVVVVLDLGSSGLVFAATVVLSYVRGGNSDVFLLKS